MNTNLNNIYTTASPVTENGFDNYEYRIYFFRKWGISQIR